MSLYISSHSGNSHAVIIYFRSFGKQPCCHYIFQVIRETAILSLYISSHSGNSHAVIIFQVIRETAIMLLYISSHS